MMITVFTFYLFAMIAIVANKRKPALIFTILGLLGAAFLLWYHATNKLGINL